MLKKFIASCWDLIKECQKHGLTVREMHQLFHADAGIPISFNTFQTYYSELNGTNARTRAALGRSL